MMMKRKLLVKPTLVLALVAAMLALAAGQGSVVSDETIRAMYPLPEFVATLYDNDHWLGSLCIETGKSGLQQGTMAQAGEAVQPCFFGHMDFFNGQLWFGRMGRVQAGIADLGTPDSLFAKYKYGMHMSVDTVYTSIAVQDLYTPAIMASSFAQGQTTSWQPMQLSADAKRNLTDTRSSNSIVPKVGHIYLVRYTDGTAPWTPHNSQAFLKFRVAHTTTDTVTVQLSPFLPSGNGPDTKPNEPIRNRHSIAIVGLVFALISFFSVIALFARTRWIKRRIEGQPEGMMEDLIYTPPPSSALGQHQQPTQSSSSSRASREHDVHNRRPIGSAAANERSHLIPPSAPPRNVGEADNSNNNTDYL
eukprot:TRINITY_DN56989_c0_g1_i1.p1 TRINITY_DN56989_c0_g1~~TRINITY_DN56989_c0_g1_i1.p1  ORF type:complete len:371 (-),score=161.72 TRINITY_DN56989_c0_g1_i1:19-1101(-)